MRFLLDEHLGRLARFLRMLGVDAALAARGSSDDEVLRLAVAEDLRILSRDRALVARSAGRARFVDAEEPRAQLAEVVAAFALAAVACPLSRCLVCNSLLRMAAADDLAAVPAGVLAEHDAFYACPGCARVYWEGSHFRRMQDFTRAVMEQRPT